MTLAAMEVGVISGPAFASMFVLISTSLTLVVAASGGFIPAWREWPIIVVISGIVALVGVGVLGGRSRSFSHSGRAREIRIEATSIS